MDPPHQLSPCTTATAALIQLLLVLRPFKQVFTLSGEAGGGGGLQFPGTTPCVHEGFTPRGKDREDRVSKRRRKVQQLSTTEKRWVKENVTSV